ncbi:unnamed protein product [Phytomonas sp. Hart1]|nr:unnamed protein product [Phytomonas sp. Hart1]|eukprot:CCW69178.1 unnamed protein product [Phytomonas sp. isolate Hart1]
MRDNFLIISLPYHPQCTDQSTSAQFDFFTRKMNLLDQPFHYFSTPMLKIGTLDSLIEASDKLIKLDTQMEASVQRLIGFMEEISGKPSNVVTTFRINQAQEMSPSGYIKNFIWSTQQFDPQDSIIFLIDKLEKINHSAEERVRAKLTEYNDLRNKILAVNKKLDGNLSIRPISEFIDQYNSKCQFFVETDLLITVFIAVPVSLQKEWLQEYWKMNEYVCPQSNHVIAEDKEYVLNSVVVFRKVADDFKSACRKKRYVTRDILKDNDFSPSELKDAQQIEERKKKTIYSLIWQQYCVCFVAWVHLKAMRIFVESVLRYGLPALFISFVIDVSSDKESEVRKRIVQLYPEFSKQLEIDSVLNVGALQQEYPYVSLKVTNIQK